MKVQWRYSSSPPTHHEELAEGDVRENVVGFVFAACDPTLLPEVGELVLQRPAGSQVENKLPGQRVIQEWVINVGEQPEDQCEQNEAKVTVYTFAELHLLVFSTLIIPNSC